MRKVRFVLWFALVLMMPVGAHAIVTCGGLTSSPSPSQIDYAWGTSAANSAIPVTVSFWCKRSVSSDPTPIDFDITPRSASTTPAHTPASNGTTSVDYRWTNDSGCTNSISPFLRGQFASLLTGVQTTANITVYLCMNPANPFPDPAASPPLYTASDQFTVVIRKDSDLSQIMTLGPLLQTVNVNVLGKCGFTSTPTNINMTYLPFTGLTSANNYSQYSIRCNTTYTMAVAPGTRVLSGIPYTLAFATGAGASIPGTLQGDGSLLTDSALTGLGQRQDYRINAAAPSGLAGDCAAGCSNSGTHVLTISY